MISIGPGAYPSNLTLGDDHSGILVLGSCEFMHNGQLISINVYVATADWLVIQIWRPVDDIIGKMVLVHSKMLQPNQTDTIVQVMLNFVFYWIIFAARNSVRLFSFLSQMEMEFKFFTF